MQYEIRVTRYPSAESARPRIQSYVLEVPATERVTVLDALLRIQRDHDPTLCFRYACRVAMCGSCAVVVNGSEALACKTLVDSLGTTKLAIEPLRNLPVIRDLLVDFGPLLAKLARIDPFFVGTDEVTDPVALSAAAPERQRIGQNTECIGCGACVSACTMVAWDPDFLGPMALNRIFTLIADSRDRHADRLRLVTDEHGLSRCHLELNCTAVCPKQLSPTRAIGELKREAVVTGIAALLRQRR